MFAVNTVWLAVPFAVSGISVKKKSNVCSPSMLIMSECENIPEALVLAFRYELVPVIGFLTIRVNPAIPVPDLSTTLPWKTALKGTFRSPAGTAVR